MAKLLLVSLMTFTLVALCACASTVEGGGGNLFPDDAKHEAAAMEQVKRRAAFDLSCEDAQLVRLSDVTRLGQQMTSMSIGATGCGQKATYYTECVSNWGKITCNPQLNSKEGASTPTSPAPQE
jgi:hypothetical protein